MPPGTTGPFGGAVTVGHLLGFDEARMVNALGIAGSCAGGLLAFAHAGNGAMLKRLNVSRGAKGGVVAGSAPRGYPMFSGSNDLTRSSRRLICVRKGSSWSSGRALGPSHLALSGSG